MGRIQALVTFETPWLDDGTRRAGISEPRSPAPVPQDPPAPNAEPTAGPGKSLVQPSAVKTPRHSDESRPETVVARGLAEKIRSGLAQSVSTLLRSPD
jgi:hypothetical protein